MTDDVASGESTSFFGMDGVSEEVLEAVGRLVSQFVLLERSMTDFAHALQGAPQGLGREAAEALSSHARRHLVLSLVEEIAPDFSGAFRKLCRQIERMEARKDALMLALWGYRKNAEGKKAVTRELDPESLTAEGVGEAAAELMRIMRSLESLRADIANKMNPAWRPGQPA